MTTLAMPVSMKSFQKLLSSLSPDVTICVRGRHAVGKSEGVYQGAASRRADFYRDPENCRKMVEALGGQVAYQNAKNLVKEWKYEYGLPVIERRLSQMTEGDIIGLPVMDGYQKSTQFRPCDWLIQATEFPVVLFLDERNRALEGVKQAVFQLADSKAFYGHRLHEEAFIAIAENIGDAYTVNQSDPAEISRAATVQLDPTQEEWLDYASTRCHDAMVEFLRQNKKCIENEGPNFEPNKKYPDRRSWFKLDAELQRLDLYENPEDQMFYVLTGAFCGVEVAQAFKRFVAERDRQVSAEDVLKDWNKAKKRLGKAGNEHYVELVSKLSDWLKKNNLETSQAVEFSKFMHDCPPEPRLSTWSVLQKSMKNLLKVHPYIEQLILRTVSGQDTSSLTPPSSTPATESTDPSIPEPRKRGARR